MKLIRLSLLVFAFLLSGTAFGQSNLPACQGRDISKWSNCVGSTTNSNGDKFVAEFKYGKFNGQGTYTWANGNKYVGELKDAKRHGQGTFTWSDDGSMYVGEWNYGNKHGQGTYTDTDGNKYVGEFKDDKKDGQGTYIFADGNKYVGESKDDKRHGQGIYYSANGSINESGIYKDEAGHNTGPALQEKKYIEDCVSLTNNKKICKDFWEEHVQKEVADNLDAGALEKLLNNFWGSNPYPTD